MDLQEQVITRFSDLLSVPRETLSKDTVIAEVVKDSLHYFELFLELEKALNTKLSFDDVVGIQTINDVVSFIEHTHVTHTEK